MVACGGLFTAEPRRELSDGASKSPGVSWVVGLFFNEVIPSGLLEGLVTRNTTPSLEASEL